MVMAAQATWTESDRVATAAMRGYALQLETAVTAPLIEMVDGMPDDAAAGLLCAVAGERRAVEIVLDDTVQADQLTAPIWSLDQRGWNVTVLVPLSQLGDAHTSLRGVPCTLQPWWRMNSGDVVFGSFETP
jgi:predicted TIM-barrel fold metal-dependent hydrolase